MGVKEFLDQSGIKYEMNTHQPTFTAQQLAAVEHEPGKFVAKPVIVKVDGKFMMCVLPASSNINLRSLKEQLGATSAELAGEDEIASIFPDCDLGAEPPFGNLYDIPTIMDKSLGKDDHIRFQGGSHEKSIRMSMEDYKKLVQPKIISFVY